MTTTTTTQAAPETLPKPLATPLRITLYITTFLVVGAGLDLYLFAQSTDTMFAWPIQPALSAAFLGANYLAAAIIEFGAARQPTWARARVAIPSVMLFTLLTAYLTLLNFDQLDLTRFMAWVWIVVYFGVPPLLALVWWRQLAKPGGSAPREAPLPAFLRITLLLLTAILLALGLFLSLAPQSAADLWPWQLTPPGKTGYASAAPMETYVGVWLISWAALLLHAALENDLRRTFYVFIAITLLPLLHSISLLRYGSVAHWSGPSPYIYLAVLLILALTGLAGLIAPRTAKAP